MQDDAESGMTTEKTDEEKIQTLLDLYEEVEPLEVPKDWEEIFDNYRREAGRTTAAYQEKHVAYPRVENPFLTLSVEEAIRVYKTAINMDFTQTHVKNVKEAEAQSPDDFYWMVIEKNQEPLSLKLAKFLKVWPVIWGRGQVNPAGFLVSKLDQYKLAAMYNGVIFRVEGDDPRAVFKEFMLRPLFNDDLPLRHGANHE